MLRLRRRMPWITRKNRGIFPFFKAYGNAWYYKQWVVENKKNDTNDTVVQQTEMLTAKEVKLMFEAMDTANLKKQKS